MATITGVSTAFTTVTTYDDTYVDSAANRAVTYQALANQCAYLKANAPVPVTYIGNAGAYGTTVDSVGNAGAWVGSTVLTTTLASVPDGTILVVDAMVVCQCSVAGYVRLEILEGSTVTADSYAQLTVGGTDVTYYLHGKFVKTGLGSVTVRLAGKGGAGPALVMKSPASVRVQQMRQF